MRVRKIAEGAFFVPSFSLQTVAPFQPGVTNQTVVDVQQAEDQEPPESIESELNGTEPPPKA